MSNFDPILSVHPVLRSFKDEIYVFDQCSVIYLGNTMHNKYVVFCTSGLFILETKTFQRGYSILTTIPLIYIKSVTLKKEFLIIKTLNHSISLRLKNQIELAAKICIVWSTLFNNEKHDFSFTVEKDLRSAFDSVDFEFSPTNINKSRFLATVLLNKNAPFNEDNINSIIDSLSCEIRDFHVTQKVLSNPFAFEICSTVAFCDSVEELIIENIELESFIPSFEQFIKYSTSIRKIVFKEVQITHSAESCKDLFSGKNLIRIDEIAFENCSILANDSNIFFDSFSQLESNVKTLSFKNCKLTSQSLDSIFQSLFFSSCFHSLETLIFTNVCYGNELAGYIFQLLCCGWVLEKKCLKSLTFKNCQLNVDELLNQLNVLDCGVLNYDFSYNSFSNNLESFNLNGLTSLVLDHCNFAGDTLLQFFNALEKNSLEDEFTIDLSFIISNEEAMEKFYQNAPNFEIPNLRGLVWDGNKVSSSDIEPFFKFLKKQPDISILSISKCFAKENQQKVLPFLTDLVRSNSFEQFCISSSKEEAFGSPLLGVIEPIVKQNKLKILDVTGQCIGDIGLFLILREMQPSLEELWFDGFCPSSVENLFTIIRSVIAHQQLKKASWPSSDVAPAMGKTRIEERAGMLRMLKETKMSFSERFGKIEETEVFKTRINTRILSEKKNSSSSDAISAPIEKDYLKNNIEAEEIFISYDENTRNLLKECDEVIGEKPLISAIRSIESELKVSTLLSKLIK